MQTRKSKYLVTGAAGFIGSHLCRKLLSKPDTQSVIGIDDINNYYNVTIKTRRITSLLQDDRFSFKKISILNTEKMRAVMRTYQPTVLIHTAAAVGVRNGENNPLEYFSTNIIGTMNVLEAAAACIKQAIIFSSSSVYGSTLHLPFRESEPIHITTPISVYGTSKVAMEMAVRNFYQRTGISTTIVRPFSIYGPDGRPDMLPIKLLIAAKTKTPIDIYAPTASSRDWTYIDDCVGMIMALLSRPNHLQTVNIGNGHPIQLNRIITIAQTIVKDYGYSIRVVNKPANSIEISNTQADTTRIKRIYTKATIPFELGFSRTAEFFFKHGDLYTSSKPIPRFTR